MRKSVVLWLFLTLSAGVLQAQHSLGYQLEKGDVFTVEQRSRQWITQEMDSSAHQLENRINALLEFRVLGVQDNGYLLEFAFRDLFFRIESSIQGELLNIRARELDESDLQSRVFNSILDVPIRMVLNRNGDILQVTGGDSLVNRMIASTGLEEGFTKSLMQKTLQQQYGSEALAASFEQMTFFYPQRQVAVGQQWTNRYEGKLEAVNTWTLDSLNTDRASISGEAGILMAEQNAGMKMNLKGTQQTQIRAERKSGFIREMTVDSEAEGVSVMSHTGDLEIPTHIRTHLTYTLIDFKHVQ